MLGPRKRKRLPFKWHYLQQRVLHRDLPTILFFPELPRQHSVAYKVCQLSGYRMTRSDTKYDLAFYWLDSTFRPALSLADPRWSKGPILNGRCIDISKERVEEAHRRAFGYGAGVDPLTYPGPMVVKSNLNAKHDGIIVGGPLTAREEGKVYQRVIQNLRTNGKQVVEYRVVYIDGRIPHVYVEHRPESGRFIPNRNDLVRLTETDQVFSSEEQRRIVMLAQDLHLDVGDLDVLRDREDGRIYVIDVNNTPNGPSTWLTKRESLRVLRRVAAGYEGLFRSRMGRS